MDNKDDISKKDDLSEILSMNKNRITDSDDAPTQIKRAGKNKEDPYSFGSSTVQSDGEDIDDSELHDIDFEEADEMPEEETDESKAVEEAERQLKKQNQRRKSVLQVILGVVISAAVIFLGANIGITLLNAVLDYTGLNSSEFEVVIEIPENPTLDQVAEVLESNGIITDTKFFKMYVESKEKEFDFVGGQFTVSSAMNYGTILSTLQASKTVRTTVEVTIIEGMTAIEVGELLEENFVCRAEDFVKYYREKMDVYDFERRVLQSSLKFNQLEGYLFPDKYEFYVVNKLRDDPKADIDTSKEAEVAAKKIYSNFNSKITKTMYKQMNEMGLTLDELITLASMVQSEVGDPEDMQKVASVFLNRLHNSETFPQLQSDVTYFYVRDFIEPYYDDYDLAVSLQTISDAYDTYVAVGVPAGAICNPGLDAINAVLNPAETDYYYFCADEETGVTYYARTIEEHEANLAYIESIRQSA
ncbi:MAG: endolytic transglycosylase MltG [Oscillospiraceae bacterium]|nr:endolytic transglycosylase MltG [Oscillospiraceae bacterium]